MRAKRRIKSAIGRWAAIASTLLLAACSHSMGIEDAQRQAQKPDNSLMRVISGDVWYRERIALPPGAELTVTLEDQSRADAPATILTDYTHTVDGTPPPYPFRLVFNPAVIDERMTYGLRARIEHNGDLLFISTQHIDPFAGKPGDPVRIRVSQP
ncbi:YbaY family lipoprotein [uncultured Halomonas sp.]|uniref:YbaY family lipoprotein n=1 Tax=Halomonas sp. H10-9-1 TaxID=2950871 RepID=UPI00260BB70B|nr:YbaY family lipoprotein [uncultured Halomonas sp.]